MRSNFVLPSSSRPLRTQSQSSNITGQCRYSGRLLPVHLSCWMCNQFTFHHQSRIDIWSSKFEQRTECSSCLWIPWRTIRILTRSTFKKPGSMEETSEYGVLVDINLVEKKGLKFYGARSNAIILQETLPDYCIPKVLRMESGDVIYEEVYVSPRLPPKISLKRDWLKELGSEVARRPEGQAVQQSQRPNQVNQIQTRIATFCCETSRELSFS